MTEKELKPNIRVCHTKHNRHYLVTSCNSRFKDSNKGWVDGVIYSPLYENEFDFFCRDKGSFLNEFEVIK